MVFADFWEFFARISLPRRRGHGRDSTEHACHSSRIELVSAVLPCPVLARQHSGELRFNVDGCAGGFGLRLGRIGSSAVGGGSGWVIRWGGVGTLSPHQRQVVSVMGASLSECDDAECGIDEPPVDLGDGHCVGHGRGDLIEDVGEVVAVFEDFVADVDDDVVEAGFGDLPVVAVVAVADQCFERGGGCALISWRTLLMSACRTPSMMF